MVREMLEHLPSQKGDGDGGDGNDRFLVLRRRRTIFHILEGRTGVRLDVGDASVGVRGAHGGELAVAIDFMRVVVKRRRKVTMRLHLHSHIVQKMRRNRRLRMMGHI